MIKPCPGTANEKCPSNAVIDQHFPRCRNCLRNQAYLDKLDEQKRLERLHNEPTRGYGSKVWADMNLECS